MFTYPVVLTPDDNDTVIATFADFPEAITYGTDKEDALFRAIGALEEAIAVRMDDREAIPPPSALKRRPGVTLPALTAAKVMVYQTMMETGVRKSDLARRLGWHGPQVDRLLDLNHASRLDQIEAALCALGKKLTVDIQDAA